MKVLLINGSPNAKGCTYTALSEIAAVLKEHHVKTNFFQLGKKAVHGCIACRKCRKSGKCVFRDNANACADLIREADGLVVGSPVYYASANGALCALLDRVFFSAGQDFGHKPSAAIVSCRRGGASAAFDRLNKYFTINEMPVVSSQYWNAVHGNTPDEVREDAEGLQIMRTLGKNMAAMLENLKTGKSTIPSHPRETRIMTNFIR